MIPFDQLLARLQPEVWLRDPRASGAGVRVCILDTGVDRALLEEKHRKVGRVLRPIEGALFTTQPGNPHPYQGQASTPHGTTVADILFTLAPEIELYSADIFGPQGSTEVEVVIRALHHALDVWKPRIINLSLGVIEQKLQMLPKRNQLQRAIEEAYFRDVLIVAAAHNDHPLTRSYPALFAPPILSVDKGLFDDPLKFAYRLRDQIEFQAHGRGYWGPLAQEPATSWAAPHLAGIAARLLSLWPELKPFEVKTLLYWISRRIPEKAGPEGEKVPPPN